MNHPERREQDAIVKLLRALGAAVYVVGTTRKRDDVHFGTMQSPGIPDLLVFLRGRFFVLEVKAPGQKIRSGSAQDDFRAYCHDARIDHVTGTCDDVIAWLTARGYLPSPNRSEAPHAATT